MSQLIPVVKGSISGREERTVDARELHRFLEVKTEFRHWIKRRIAQYGFVPDLDFLAVKIDRHEIIEQFDYYLTLDMAKELAMVERTAKGREARRYFIACERRALAAARAAATRNKRKALPAPTPPIQPTRPVQTALPVLPEPAAHLPPMVRSRIKRCVVMLLNWNDPELAPLSIASMHVESLRMVAHE